ncbi:MAG: hypothetical protein FJW53_01435 [Actinobacteria bacterium]|nr:hypothetical protein [Actinomycetota bacterium]
MRRLVAATILVALAACGGADNSAPGPSPQSPPTTIGVPDSAPTSAPTAPTTSSVVTPRSSASQYPTTTVAPSNTGDVSYTVRDIGRLSAAVDVVERDTADGFVYVVSRLGTVERWRNDGTRIDRVLDVTASTTGGGERGLLGLAFRRGGSGDWAAYVNMTDSSDDTIIVRHDVTTDGKISPSGTIILTIDQPYSNHNGGDLRVGPDGMLYIATGDGGSAGDPERRARDLSSLLGKILRIDPSRTGYTVPRDNPHVGVAGARPEIWSIGLRNPWRFSFGEGGDLWVADVGQGEIEEVSVARARTGFPGGRGVDFGWSAWEGTRRYNQDQLAPAALAPAAEYDHGGGRCSISGAAVGTERAVPGRAGWFFYGDYCSGDLWASLVVDGGKTRTETVADDLDELTAVRTTSAGLWVTTLSGAVLRVSTRPG